MGRRKVIRVGIDDLKTTHPIIASEWHPTLNKGLIPEMTTKGMELDVWWQKECLNDGIKHMWHSPINKRTQTNDFRGCSICSGHQLQLGVNDLSSVRPDIAREWHFSLNGDLRADMITSGNGKEVWWQKECLNDGIFHEWKASIKERTRPKSKGCAICSGKQIQIGVNDLNSIMPSIAKEWHPLLNGELNAKKVTKGSNLMVWWQKECLNDGIFHEWKSVISDRTKLNKPSGCAICNGKQIQIGVNDLNSQRPDVSSQWHPTMNGELMSTGVTVGSIQEVWWQKECLNDGVFHQWSAPVCMRTKIKDPHGCSICSGHQVQIGVNDLTTVRPDIALEWHPTLNGDLEPTIFTKGSDAEIWWQHKGLETNVICNWKQSIEERTRTEGTHCPECSHSKGFDKTKPAMLYVIVGVIKGKEIVQFGISNKIKSRLLSHNRSGFTMPPIALLRFSIGGEALELEKGLKKLMKRYKVPNCTQIGVKFDGSTEAFAQEDITLEFRTAFEHLVNQA